MMTTGSRRRPPGLTWLLSGAATALIAVLAAALVLAVRETAPPAWTPLACAVLVFASVLLRMDVRFGSQTVVFVWLEAAVVFSLFLLPPGWLVLTTATGLLAALLVQRYPPSKILLNAAAVSLGAGAAALLYRALAGGSAPDGHAVVGSVVAAVTFTLISDAAVSSAVALSQGLRVRDVITDGLGIQALTTLGNVAAALGILALLRWEPKLLLALPPLLLATHSAYRHRLTARLERHTWEQLVAATTSLASLQSEDVEACAVRDLTAFYGADLVEIRITDPALGSIRPTLSPAETPPPSAAQADHQRTVTQTLLDAGGDLGEIRLHFNGPITLTAREQASLATYSAALATALRNAALHRHQRHEATHDPLTGLANRTLLLATGAVALGADTQAAGVTALLLLDLDHFKHVNDTLGHDAGDDLLLLLADRLTQAVAPGDLVARLGGDEFAVLLTALPDSHAAIIRARGLAAAITRPLHVSDMDLSIEASIGVACAPQDGTAMRELLRGADVAMYEAKTKGSGVERYDPTRDAGTVEHLATLGELRHALRRGELVLHYQPQVHLDTGIISAVEALVRWNHPTRGLLQPADFVPIVETSGLIRDFTLHILDLALREANQWAAQGIDVPVAINLSARLLMDVNLPQQIAHLLADHHYPPDKLILEITETVAMSALDVVERVLSGLGRLGVELSVDDFGTGYSSMTFLSRTTLQELKIDRSFVAGLLTSPGDAAIVRATIDLARSFGLRVVAEGIESEAQQRTLLALGCHYGQGYHIAKPMPANALLLALNASATDLATVAGT